MAFRLLVGATLLVGAFFSFLSYILVPRGRSSACSVAAACPDLTDSTRIAQAFLPLAVAAGVVLLAMAIHRKHPRSARMLLSVPMVVLVAGFGGLLAAAFLGV